MSRFYDTHSGNRIIAIPVLCAWLFLPTSVSAQTYDCKFSHDCYQAHACTTTREKGRLERTRNGWQWTPVQSNAVALHPIGPDGEPSPHLVLVSDYAGNGVMLISLFETGEIRLTSNFWYDEARTITFHGHCTRS